MTRWEYRVVKLGIGGFTGPKVDTPKLERALDELGGDGWELVSTLDTNIAQGSSDELVLFLKRPQLEDDAPEG